MRPVAISTWGAVASLACGHHHLLCDLLVPRADVMAPLRHAAVDLHRRQMRSPAHSLGKGAAQTKHSLVLETMSRSAAGLLWSLCIF
jgi:hypothetical protein